MRIPRLLTTALLLTLVATSAAAKRPSDPSPSPLYVLDKAPLRQAASRSLIPDAAEEFLIQVNPEEVAANPASFLIDLPDQPLLEAVRTRFVVYGPDWKSWIGTLRYAGTREKGTGYIHLGYHGDQLTALIDFEGQHFRIAGGGKEGQRLARISEDLSPRSCGHDHSSAGELLFADAQEGSAASQMDSGPVTTAPATTACTATSTTSTIDVLAVYPRAFFRLGPSAETALFNFIQDSISLANDAFCKSQINAVYKLVGILPIIGASQPDDSTEKNGITKALRWLNSRPAEVTNLREAFGADIVTIFVPWSWNFPDNCGRANLPNSQYNYFNQDEVSVPGEIKDYPFTAHRDGCGLADYTLGHEIGHNYGMRHHNDNASVALFPNGRGNVIEVNGRNQATVMGCYRTVCFDSSTCPLGSGAVCNRIPYFSDPNILTPEGVATGAPDRNNAQVGRIQVLKYTGFRTLPEPKNTPPTANFTVSCSGRVCMFNATSSTDNSGISNYWWDFGDGDTSQPNTGSTVSHTYASGVSFPVHLVVTDNGANGGQKNVKAMIVEPQPVPPYEGYHDVASCSTISGWAWDPNRPNTPINVSIYRDNTHIATILADRHRQDLVNAGKGNGYHAFDYPLSVDPTWKDGVPHSVRVRYDSTATSLYWSPRNILCGVTCFTNQKPLNNLSNEGQAFTLGTQFSSSVNGTITHLGFYRAPGEPGTNIAKLWTDSGTQLGNEVTLPTSPIEPSGWFWKALNPPVAITAGTRYRVAVTTNVMTAKTNCGIPGGITNQYLTAHQGVWSAGSGIFPATGTCSNFFVDVKFDP